MTLRGQTIGGYQVAEVIGQGGMAEVYKAYQPRLERWVAIKVLTPQLMTDTQTQFLARFRREARTLSLLRHPNILTVYDYGEENGVAYIVTEYVSGGTLRQRLSGTPLAWPAAAALIMPVCQALAYAHEQGIFHRDIKPANILMPREDWPLLADFGLVKLAQANERLTQLGASLGTPEYMSPEQAVGEETDQRTDIYSVGVLLYELLTGTKPFTGDNPLEIIIKHLKEEPVSPREHNPELSVAVAALVLKALAKNAGERFQSMGEMIASLQEELERAVDADRDAARPAPVPPVPGTGIAAEAEVELGACPHCGAEVNLARATCSHCSRPIPPQRKITAGRMRAVRLHSEQAQAGANPAGVSPATVPFAQNAESLRGPRLVLESGIELLVPPKVEVLIGRADPRNKLYPDIDLAPHNGGSLGVSRNHARLVFKGEQWYLEDLNSTNGTFVNDVRLLAGTPVPLDPSCQIQCGRMSMVFRDK